MCILSNIRIRIIRVIKMIYINDDTKLKVIDLLSGDFYVNWYGQKYINDLNFLMCNFMYNVEVIYDYGWLLMKAKVQEEFNTYYHNLHKLLFLHPELDITERNMKYIFWLAERLD